MALAEPANPAGAVQSGAGAPAAVWHAVSRRQPTQVWFVAADFAMIWLTAVAALVLRFTPEFASRLGLAPLYRSAHLAGHLGFLLLYSVLVVLFCHAYGLYEASHRVSRAEDSWAVCKAVGFAIGVQVLCICVSGLRFVSRFVIGFTVAGSSLLLVEWRRAHHLHLQRTCADGSSCRNVLIVGCGEQALALGAHLNRNRQLGYQVCGLVACGEEKGQSTAALGTVSDLPALTRRHFIDDLLVSVTDPKIVKRVVLEARKLGLNVGVLPDLYDGLGWGAPVDYLGQFPVLTLHQQALPASRLFLKRPIDVALSASALAVFSPLFLLIAIAVKLSSRGDIFYAAERVGRKGRTFRCYKFRTMISNADALQASLQHLNQRDRILFKIANDPRLTRVGRYLRKYSLDELPQLWNVLKGEMSLVGPRPPLAGEVRRYELEHLRRLDVVPGITGLWQVQSRTNPSFARYFSLDVDYVDHWSPWLDTKILFKTIAVVLKGTGQ